MKTKIFHQLLLIIVAIAMYNCSEPPVVPVEPTEDIATHAEAYSPNVFVMEITTQSYAPYPQQPVELQIAGTAGSKIAINWGDGTIDKITLAPYSPYPEPPYIEHQYSRVKNYTIKVDGDIKNIEYIKIGDFGPPEVNNIYLSGLTGLKRLELSYVTGSLAEINLSHNKLLEILLLEEMPGLRNIIMPATTNLISVQIMITPQLSTAAIDRVIGRVYESVVSNPRSGYFDLNKEGWWDNPDRTEMVGPPSSYSITKLKRLRAIYGWEVYPDPDVQ
jgi:hypothetical protein